MITQEVTQAMLSEWKAIWTQYKDQLQPNIKSGAQLIAYLKNKYVIHEFHDTKAAEAITRTIMENAPYAAKLPAHTSPAPRTFWLENEGEGETLFDESNSDDISIWGHEIDKVFVGIDEVTGYYMIDGSTLLWDELCAYRGLDQEDIQNFVCVAQYIQCLQRFHLR